MKKRLKNRIITLMFCCFCILVLKAQQHFKSELFINGSKVNVSDLNKSKYIITKESQNIGYINVIYTQCDTQYVFHIFENTYYHSFNIKKEAINKSIQIDFSSIDKSKSKMKIFTYTIKYGYFGSSGHYVAYKNSTNIYILKKEEMDGRQVH